MISSSTHTTRTESRPVQLAGEHWFEMTATLSPGPLADLDEVITADLKILEQRLLKFASPRAAAGR